MDKGTRFFHINNLLEESQLSYYNSKSQKYSFGDAKKLIESL